MKHETCAKSIVKHEWTSRKEKKEDIWKETKKNCKMGSQRKLGTNGGRFGTKNTMVRVIQLCADRETTQCNARALDQKNTFFSIKMMHSTAVCGC